MGERKHSAEPSTSRSRERPRAVLPFGREIEGESAPGDLTDFGCPDCRGVLAVQELGKTGHLSFACRVGHTFSGESLSRVKEEQLEYSLWTAVEVFEEIVLLHRELASRERALGAGSHAEAHE